MRTAIPLLVLAACVASPSTSNVLHGFSDRALEIARRAAPEAEWAAEVDPPRAEPYAMPHTELVMLRGRVEDVAALRENLEIEVLRVLLRQRMKVHSFRSDLGSTSGEDPHALWTARWVYRGPGFEGVLTLWGRRQESGAYVLAVTIHESRNLK